MLSAIAARKAAQAARQIPAESPIVVPKSPSLPPRRPTTPIKRKPSSQPQSASKKKKRVKHAQQPHIEENFITVDDEDDDGERVVSDISLDDVAVPQVAAGKRAWSPSRPLNDSSDDDGDAPHAVREPDDPPLGPTQLSTFVPAPGQNIFNITLEELAALGLARTDDLPAVALALAPGETLCLLGTYTLVITHGTVTLAGVRLHAAPTAHRVFAPRSAPLPVLEGLPTDAGNAPRLPARLAVLGTHGAVLVLQELRTGVEGLGDICRTFAGVFAPPRWHASSPTLVPGAHMVIARGKDVHPFVLSPSWAAALATANASEAGIYLVKGPKKTGKSTFARALLNTLLMRYQRVAFLECDLGQSEFTPGGMVALNVLSTPVFGPPFTHPTVPDHAHYIGAATPQSSPSHYLAAIEAALHSYRLELEFADPNGPADGRIAETTPLVVNTMGWTKGLGLDLARRIEALVAPTHIFETAAPLFDTPLHDFWPPALPAPGTHILKPTPTTLADAFAPADHRALALLSYFHAHLAPASPPTWDTTRPLIARPPHVVDPVTALDRVVLVGAGTEDVVPAELPRVLAGALVALVACTPGALDPAADLSAGPLVYTQGAPPPPPALSTCRGLALVRGAAADGGALHVLTPLPPAVRAGARVLVKGALELPVWGFLGAGGAGGTGAEVPYLQWGKGAGVGGVRRRVRRNLMRRGQA